MFQNTLETTRQRLRVLGKRHTMEILAHISESPKYITQIAEETRIPYTTVQHRVNELERSNLIKVINGTDEKTGKAVKLITVSHFNLQLDEDKVKQMVERARSPLI